LIIAGRRVSGRRLALAIVVTAFVEVVLFSVVHRSVRFSGDASAERASVYIDGAFVGSLSTAADTFTIGGSAYHRTYCSGFEASVRPGRHLLAFVSRAGDTLTSEFTPKLVSTVNVSFAARSIDVDPPPPDRRAPPRHSFTPGSVLR
jgi:hypothetical protein